MDDIDELLSIIENPTRRRILEYLTREPAYPLQLSKELGISQQAVMKNLALMEHTGMLTRYTEQSSMGPTRNVYVPNQQFTIMIDLHDNMFSARLITSDGESTEETHIEGTQEAFERLGELDKRIEELDRERAELLNERSRLISTVRHEIRSMDEGEEKEKLSQRLDRTIGNKED